MRSRTKGGLFPNTSIKCVLTNGDRVQRYAKDGTAPECTAEAIEIFRRLRHETLTAERLAVIGLRNDGVISDDVLHRLEQELDVEALQLGIGERRVSSGGEKPG
jgi:monovalent cation/hydrogen antiporter